MPKKFELSIDANYVSSWGIVEAVREFFQNSYDEEIQNSKNKSFFEYDRDNECLRIGNKLSILKSETLLLGCTTKNNDSNTIGQFGEGYKIATVVALRTGHNVTIYNYGAREVWTTKLVKSRRYNRRLVPTFYISNEFNWSSLFKNKTEEKNLVIEISNITEDEYSDICNSNLNLQEYYSHHNTEYGELILDESHKGNIYVSGLFVYNDPDIQFSYNIKSEHLKLDRDRMAVNSFDLKWVTAKIWVQLLIKGIVGVKNFVELLEKDIMDFAYIDSVLKVSQSLPYNKNGEIESVINEIYKEYLKKYGRKYPIDSEMNRRKMNISFEKVAFINSNFLSVLNLYEGEDKLEADCSEKSYYDRYKELFDSLQEFMTDDQKCEADSLLNETRYILS